MYTLGTVYHRPVLLGVDASRAARHDASDAAGDDAYARF